MANPVNPQARENYFESGANLNPAALINFRFVRNKNFKPQRDDLER